MRHTVYYLVRKVAAVTGRDLRNARPSLDENNQPAVSFTLEHRGRHASSARSRARTSAVSSRSMLDGRVQSAPRIDGRITTDGRIIGSFTQQEVQDLSLILRSGSLSGWIRLPLGADDRPDASAPTPSARASMASIVGLLLVVVFMLVYYRLVRRERGRRAALQPDHPARPDGVHRRRHDAAGHRRLRADDGHRRGLERADLRANQGRARARARRARSRSTRVSAACSGRCSTRTLRRSFPSRSSSSSAPARSAGSPSRSSRIDVEPVHLDFRVEDAVRAGARRRSGRRTVACSPFSHAYFQEYEFQFPALALARARLLVGIIIAGVVHARDKGDPQGHRVRRRHRRRRGVRRSRSRSTRSGRRSIATSREAGRTRSSSRTAIVAQETMIRVPTSGSESGESLSNDAGRRVSGAHEGQPRRVHAGRHADRRPDRRRGADQQALWATILSLVGLLVYIAFRFQFSFAVGAVVATIHDLLITLAFLTFFHYDMSLNVIAAILTITGFSTNDTIVIFDRIRENLRTMRRDSMFDVINARSTRRSAGPSSPRARRSSPRSRCSSSAAKCSTDSRSPWSLASSPAPTRASSSRPRWSASGAESADARRRACPGLQRAAAGAGTSNT